MEARGPLFLRKKIIITYIYIERERVSERERERERERGIFFTILYLDPFFQNFWASPLQFYIDFIIIAFALIVK